MKTHKLSVKQEEFTTLWYGGSGNQSDIRRPDGEIKKFESGDTLIYLEENSGYDKAIAAGYDKSNPPQKMTGRACLFKVGSAKELPGLVEGYQCLTLQPVARCKTLELEE